MRRETFHTPGTLTLDLRVPSGEIAIESVDGEETTVELDATGASDAVRELVDNARIELRQRGDGYEVLVDVPRRRGGLGLIFDRADFLLRVFAPHGADVQVSTASADVDGRGRCPQGHRLLQLLRLAHHHERRRRDGRRDRD